MTFFYFLSIGVFGAIVGSFLNVVIYRIHTGKSLNGRSHCMSCGKTLSWYELFPVCSYLFLRGRCRTCMAHIPPRYVIVEMLTAFLFIMMGSVFEGDIYVLAFNLILVSLLMVIVVYDIRHTIIPDELSMSVGLITLVYLGYAYYTGHQISQLFFDGIAGIGASGFFAGLWYISKGKWIGLGDAKLALPLGVLVGLNGVFSMVVFSFWIGAILSLGMMALWWCMKKWKTRLHFSTIPITMKSEVPFAPFLVMGFLLVYTWKFDVFKMMYALFFS